MAKQQEDAFQREADLKFSEAHLQELNASLQVHAGNN